MNNVDKSLLKAYKMLKKNPKLVGVIYAYTQNGRKVFLEKPLGKYTQEDIQEFADSFKRPRQKTRVTLDVLYQDRIKRIESYLKGNNLLEKLNEALDIDFNENDKVVIQGTDTFWDGYEGVVREIDLEFNTAIVNVAFNPEQNKYILQEFELTNLKSI